MDDVDDCCKRGACWPVGKLIAESQCRGRGIKSWIKEVLDNSSLDDSCKTVVLSVMYC